MDDAPAATSSTSLPRGALIAVRPSHDADWTEINATLASARRAHSVAALIYWGDLIPYRSRALFSANALRTGVSAVIDAGRRPHIDSIREQLTNPQLYATAVPAWLIARGVKPTKPGMQELLRMPVFAWSCRTLAATASAARIPESTLRRRFAHAGIGTPSKWRRLFSTTAIGLLVQQHPARPLAEIAELLGIFDAAGVRKAIREVVGASTRDVRQFLGWEWMLWHGAHRLGLLPIRDRVARTSSSP